MVRTLKSRFWNEAIHKRFEIWPIYDYIVFYFAIAELPKLVNGNVLNVCKSSLLNCLELVQWFFVCVCFGSMKDLIYKILYKRN